MKIPSKTIDLDEALWDIDRFPVPICFDPEEEKRRLYRRDRHIKDVVERFNSMAINLINTK